MVIQRLSSRATVNARALKLFQIPIACDDIMCADPQFTTPFHVEYNAGQVWHSVLNACMYVAPSRQAITFVGNMALAIPFILCGGHVAPQQLRVILKNKRGTVQGRCVVSGSHKTRKCLLTPNSACTSYMFAQMPMS